MLGLILIINTQTLVYNIYYMPNLSKYDVLNLLSKKMPFYAATQWLKTCNEALANQAPSDLMKDGQIEIVYNQLQKEIEDKKKKK